MIHATDGHGGAGAGPIDGGDGGGWFRFLRGPPRQPPKEPRAGPDAARKAYRRHSSAPDDSAPRDERRRPPEPPRCRSMVLSGRVPRRQPSIPTSIVGRDPPEDLDESGRSDVSEVTLMTYSDEKAKVVKEEFFDRLRQREKDRTLSLEDKEALLREVQEEQEDLFQRRREEDRRKAKEERRKAMERRRQSVEEKKELFERLGALRLRKEKEESERRLSQPEEGFEEVMADLAGTGDGEGASPASLTPKSKSEEALIVLDNAVNDLEDALNVWNRDNVAANEGSPANGKLGGAGLRKAGLLSLSHNSSGTMKHCNNERNDSWATAASEDDAVGERGAAEEPEATTPRADPPRRDAGPDQRAQEVHGCEGSAPGLHDTPGLDERIAEIVELKLLAAEQQATIDTLSSELHNLRLADRRRHETQERGVGLWKDLEKELPRSSPRDLKAQNRELARRLDQSQESEAGLRRELDLRKSFLDESDRERGMLEGRNRELERENRELRRMLKESRQRAGGVVGGGLLDHSHRSGSGRSRRGSVRSSTTTQTTAALSTDMESAKTL